MFETAIPKTKEPINLTSYERFEDKVTAVCDYAEIRNIYVAVSNPQDLDLINPVQLTVTHINVPMGSMLYAKKSLKECYTILTDEVKKYILGDDDFDGINQTLDRCIEKCIQAAEKHNIYDIFTFDQNVRTHVYREEKWYPTLFHYLDWSESYLHEDVKEHYNLRNGFFDKMVATLTNVQQIHQLRPDPTKKPYTWDSPNAELELSELIYLLCKKSELIKINPEHGGSFAKFKKESFGLYGLDDKNYDKKLSQILDQKKDKHFIDILAGYMPNTSPAPPKKK